MNLLKRLFSTTTNEISFKKEIFLLVFLILILPFFIIINLFSPPKWIDIIMRIIMILDIIPCIPLSIVRLVGISDNREEIARKEGKIKYKFPYKEYSIEKILFWLDNAKYPDKLYITSVNSKHFTIEVTFETKGKNGPFIKKGYKVDKDIIPSILQMKNFMYENKFIDENGFVRVDAITENNDPILFEKVINNIQM